MSTIDTEKKLFILELLRLNMVQPFDIDGNGLDFDFERHICYSIMDIPRVIGSSKERRLFGVYAAVYLGLVWNINICKSHYDKKYILAVIVENDWMCDRHRAAPPCVVLNTRARKAVYEHKIYKKVKNEADIISQYQLEAILNNRHYEIFLSKTDDLKIVLEYQE